MTITPAWELEFVSTDRCTTVRSTDPWEVTINLNVGGDYLELVVNDEGAIVDRIDD